jgi:hypothetical protein
VNIVIHKIDKNKLLIYVLIPLTLTTILAAMYFSHILVLHRLVSPKLPPLLADSWREFGLLENAQNILLLVMVVVLLVGVWRATEKLQRLAFCLVALFTLFVFLEEVDYFTHWHAYLTAEENIRWFDPMPLEQLLALADENEEATNFNLHNQGEMTKIFKIVGDFTIISLFVLLPLIAPYIRNRYVRYAAPEHYTILTCVLMLVMSKLIHQIGKVDEFLFKAVHIVSKLDQYYLSNSILGGWEPTMELGSISSNLSEFRELNMYYLFMVYLIVLVFYRRLENSQG